MLESDTTVGGGSGGDSGGASMVVSERDEKFEESWSLGHEKKKA